TAPGGGDPHPADPLAPPVLALEQVELRAFAVAARAHEQHHGATTGDVTSDDAVVAALELHAVHPGGVAAHSAYAALGETDRHALTRYHDDVVASGGLDHFHQLVVAVQVDCLQSASDGGIELRHPRLLDHAILRRKEEVRAVFVRAGVDDRLDLLPLTQRHQVH